MQKIVRIVSASFGLALFIFPIAVSADATLSVQSLFPGTTISVGTPISFTVLTGGLSTPSYTMTDSASSSLSSSNINAFGQFSWTPISSDAGSHTITINATDGSNSASVQQVVTVNPKPVLTVGAASPSSTVMPGTQVSFNVSAVGFTSPSYIVGDAFSGSSVTDNNIDSSGNFTWKPIKGEEGAHVITVYAMDNSGHQANVSTTIQVGAGRSLAISSLMPGATVSTGNTVSFTVTPTAYTPTAFSVSDLFSGASSISSNNINTGGVFSWTPSSGDVGTHVLTVTGTVGAYGDSATTTQTITVYGPGGAPPASTVSTSTAPASTSTSTSSSATTLSALQAQLAQLLAQAAALGGGSTSSSSASSPGYSFGSALSVGMSGTAVTQLQTVLAQQGFFSGTPSGYFGAQTKTAVMAFQKSQGISQLGNVGPDTRAALNAILAGSTSTSASTSSSTASSSSSASTAASGTVDSYVFNNFIELSDSGTDVTELQTRLAALGYFSGDITGYFGAKTEAAVKAFQAAKGLDQKGYVGVGTRAALNATVQ